MGVRRTAFAPPPNSSRPESWMGRACGASGDSNAANLAHCEDKSEQANDATLDHQDQPAGLNEAAISGAFPVILVIDQQTRQ